MSVDAITTLRRGGASRRRAPILSALALVIGSAATAFALSQGMFSGAVAAAGLASFGAACLAVDFGLVQPLRRLVQEQGRAIRELEAARRSDAARLTKVESQYAARLTTVESQYAALHARTDEMKGVLATRASGAALDKVKETVRSRASVAALHKVKETVRTRASVAALHKVKETVRTRASVERLEACKRDLDAQIRDVRANVFTRASKEALVAVREELAKKASGAALSSLKEQVRTNRGEINKMQPRLSVTASAKALGNVQADVKNLYGHVKSLKASQGEKASAAAVLRLRDDVDRIFGRVRAIRTDLAGKASAGALKSAKAMTEDRTQKLSARLSALQMQSSSYHVHTRFLSPADIETLVEDWAKPLGLAVEEPTIRYLADRIRVLENLCEGRLATDLQTMLARSLAALSLDGDTIAIAEIGTLFGVCAGVLHEFCANRYDAVSLTLIDPLEGYYDKSSGDIITQVPVSRRILEKNLRLMGTPEAASEILQGLSEDEDILRKVEGRMFDFLIIDGDHSYDGVKRDFENYVSLVRPGGLIVFDDYDVVAWPDIKRYVDEEIATDTRVGIVATGFRTALVRRIAD